MATITAKDMRVLVVDDAINARASVVPTLQACGYHGATLSTPQPPFARQHSNTHVTHRMRSFSHLPPPAPPSYLATQPSRGQARFVGRLGATDSSCVQPRPSPAYTSIEDVTAVGLFRATRTPAG
jgi:hypothetical protein